jgi:hypothetical protein
MPPTHFYLLGAEQLDQLPVRDWKKARISILASLPQPFSQTLFVDEWNPVSLAAIVTSIRAAVPRADLYLSWGASCERAVQLHRPELATLGGYDVGGPWLRNVELLARAMRTAGFQGAALDAEIYVSTPGNSGGPMVPGVAWPASSRIRAHASAFRTALGGLPLLCFVWLDDLLRTTRAGVPLFPGWRAWVRGAHPALILDEGAYVSRKGYTGTHWEHIRVVQGEYLTRKVARGLARRKEARFLWSQEPPGEVWG